VNCCSLQGLQEAFTPGSSLHCWFALIFEDFRNKGAFKKYGKLEPVQPLTESVPCRRWLTLSGCTLAIYPAEDVNHSSTARNHCTEESIKKTRADLWSQICRDFSHESHRLSTSIIRPLVSCCDPKSINPLRSASEANVTTFSKIPVPKYKARVDFKLL